MHPLLGRVSRLQQLAVFECAARLRSFTAAAGELGMTQPAVSRRIAGLERSTGLELFRRTANRVSLTPAGESLLAAVQAGFDTIDSAVTNSQSAGPTFLLAANPGFAQHWLVPHLEQLRSVIGDADLRLRLFDRDGELANESYDAAIHLAPKAEASPGSHVLFDEIVVPVAAPDLAETRGLRSDADPASLLPVVKLHLDGRDRQWMDWTDWFGAHGVAWSPADEQVSYNNYPLVVNEALAGRGVALAWRGLVDDLLVNGSLVTVGPEVHRPNMAYQLLTGPGSSQEAVDRLAAWLRRHRP